MLTLLSGGVVDSPVDTGNDTGGGSGTVITKDLDGNKIDGLADTVDGTANGAGDVSTVTVQLECECQ